MGVVISPRTEVERRGAELHRLASRRRKGLSLTSMVLEGKTHKSVPGGGLSRGLRSVFGAWPTEGPAAMPAAIVHLCSRGAA